MARNTLLAAPGAGQIERATMLELCLACALADLSGAIGAGMVDGVLRSAAFC